MEYFRSTLATTAVAVLGLVAAAHILHPGNYEMQTRPARPAAVSAPAPVAAASWADPPARVHAATSLPVLDQEVALTPAPLTTTALATDAPAVQPARSAAARPERPRKTATAERRKLAQRALRARQAALVGGASTTPAAVDRPEARETRTSDRIDPIGDLIRGLGLGRDS